MKYIIFILLILVIVFLVLYYERKLFSCRKQLLIANNQINSLRQRVPKTNPHKKNKKFEIKFSAPNSNMGIINENSNIYISPLKSSELVQHIDIKMEVKILDKAELNSEHWYYISLPMDSNINSRGWIPQRSFSYFYGNSTNITKNT